MVSLRLAYQDLEVQQKKKDQAMSRMDPKKAQQMERLGMGFGSGAAPRATGFNSTKSHSLMSDSGVIVQEEPGSARTAQFTSNTKDNFFDDFEVLTCTVLTSRGGALHWSRDQLSCAIKTQSVEEIKMAHGNGGILFALICVVMA